ncbi:HK97 gp10 family phage protein [Aureibacillus halotolerans]|uniref:Bacteriophage HK97-gp10 putative tail-component n=1 Tax=Aureibacillus halotolerans TaxID=1508390 RepID=A0A4R6TQQ6_9BACI|nr:HK97 gp10 family phage protein [Aureibacillus halotolerans]TDQ35279.1 bacteriophage HK97-gp10 putative tail-component [Aureibacillus halotolerans]
MTKFGFKGMGKLLADLEKAEKGMDKQIKKWFEGIGYEFLAIVQDEIIRTGTTDTRALLHSFEYRDSANVYEFSRGGMELTVGTRLDYATYANDGHFTINPSTGKDRRWVPGRWKANGSFEYDPNAKTGMLLTLKWVDGSGYWDNAIAIYERMFKRSLEKKVQQWLDGLGR